MARCINLDTLIAPTFRQVIADIITAKVSRAILKGGRNTTKSQIVSEAIIVGCMQYKYSAIAIVKHSNKIEERLVNTFKESLRYLGVESKWKLRRSPMELVLLDRRGRETDVSIKFAGADDPENLKSYKPRSKSFRYIWIEEATNFPNKAEIDNISITMARGVGDHVTILTFNPPKSKHHWCNVEYANKCGIALGFSTNEYRYTQTIQAGDYTFQSSEVIHHSTYLDILQFHPEWLGEDFLSRIAAYQGHTDNPEYQQVYLGAPVAGEGNIFPNVKKCRMSDFNFGNLQVYRGLDMSNGGSDPYRYVQCIYDKRSHSIFITGEYSAPGTTDIRTVAQSIRKLNPNNFAVMTDSAVPTFIRQLNSHGLAAVNVKKRPDSVAAGIAWLRSLVAIYIDPSLTPKTYKEFEEYAYKVLRDGSFDGTPPDKNNHSIDAVRYALVNVITYQ